jgi:hypothetical protein
MKLLPFIVLLAMVLTNQANALVDTKSISKPIIFEQRIPLAVMLPDDQKAICTWIQIKSEPRSTQNINTITFAGGKMSPAVQETLKAQICSGVLFGSLMWQENLQDVQWTIVDAPWIDRTSNLAGLTLGLIATASGTPYPSDTIVLGTINPDHSLGAISQIEKRIAAAAAAGMKRVIIPYLQRIQTTESGSIVNLQNRIEASGMKCVPVQNLGELMEVVLGRVPQKNEIVDSTSYSSKVLTFLDSQCRKEFFALESLSARWPRDPTKLAALKPVDQTLWKEIPADFDSAKRLYQAGLLYSAYRRFIHAEAKLHALSAMVFANGKFEYKDYEQRGKLLLQKIKNLQMTQPSDELMESALFEAERSDWMGQLAYQVESAQVFARQAFAARSDADSSQRELAQARLQRSVEEAEYLLAAETNFFSDLKRVWSFAGPSDARSKASELLPNLRLTYLAFSDQLTESLKNHSNALKEKLIFDENLLAQTKTVNELKKTIKTVEDEKEAAETPQVSQVGFVPSAAYVPQKIESISAQELPMRNDLLQCFDWANDFSRLASLNQKYVQLGINVKEDKLQFDDQKSIVLQRMLEYAELQARKNIFQIKKAGINPQILSMILEEGEALKADDGMGSRLEALRQYWRCSLLSEIGWQLSSQRTPMIVEERKVVPAEINNSITAIGQVSTNAIKTSPVYSPQFQTQSNPYSTLRLNNNGMEIKPTSIPAVPLSPEDLALIGNE